jgi:RimJ/RimL family protein N-acetyltransferase
MKDSSQRRIETPRLTLIEATISMLIAEGEHVAVAAAANQSGPGNSLQSEFEALLGAGVAAPWPPPLNDEDSRRWMIRLLGKNPEPGWGMWYFILKRGPATSPVAIGNGGFKGPPSPDGRVEVGYSVVPSYQGRGLGAEAVGGLVARAFQDSRVMRVIAETLFDNIPSLRLLEKNGFRKVGAGSEAGSVLLQRDREAAGSQ